MSNRVDPSIPAVDPGLRHVGPGRALPYQPTLPSPVDNVVMHSSANERFGIRGPGTVDWLRSEGLDVPGAVNEAIVLACGTAVLRLGQQEVLLHSPLGDSGGRVRELRGRWRESMEAEKGYDAFREETWAWTTVSGPDAPHLMRRISMTDLRPRSLRFGQVAQTRALHMDAVISRLDHFGAVSYDIFFDIASTSFALDILLRTTAGLGLGFRVSEIRPR